MSFKQRAPSDDGSQYLVRRGRCQGDKRAYQRCSIASSTNLLPI
jgi:hypothetical protein